MDQQVNVHRYAHEICSISACTCLCICPWQSKYHSVQMFVENNIGAQYALHMPLPESVSH